MKIDELIKALEQFKVIHGNLPVKSDGDYYGISGVSLLELDDETKKWAVLEVVYDDDLPDDEV